MLISGNKNKSLESLNSNYFSLTATNGKEESFKNLKKTWFKTYDKNFNMDIFDSNDEEIVINDTGKNNEISLFIDK